MRVSGGPGLDQLDDSHSGGTRFYDVEDPEEVEGPARRSRRGMDARPTRRRRPGWRRWTSGAPRPAAPLVGAGPGHRAVDGRRPVRLRLPQAALRADAAGRARVQDQAQGVRRHLRRRLPLDEPGLHHPRGAVADGAKNYNFFGFGNDTPFESDDFNEAHQKEYYAFPSLVAYENGRRTLGFALGPEVKYAQNAAEDGTLIATEQPYGFGDFGQVGAKMRLHADTRGRQLAGLGAAGFAPGSKRSDTGLKVDLEGRVYPEAWDVEETLWLARGELTGYWQVASRLTLAARAGGQKNWGRYPWHESAFIGGSDSVRGYDRNRFAGDSSFYTNAQVHGQSLQHEPHPAPALRRAGPGGHRARLGGRGDVRHVALRCRRRDLPAPPHERPRGPRPAGAGTRGHSSST